ncbi:O-antigen polymerase [Arthrobacter sp. 4R501]|uniref:O-antigen polymerase n=1 Tax=Arthrobacter sp. 4R501 TaxID=2058886 RepID=UPI000CE49E46|nr:O-antigen polymerase [Arthrobacter sp. 4R501]
MNVGAYFLPIVGLGLYSIGGFIISQYIARRLGRFLNFRTLVILNYIIVNLVSGIVHLSQVEGATRGYFDIVNASDDATFNATVGSMIGLMALCAACLHKLPAADFKPTELPEPWLVPGEQRFLFLTTAVMLPITIYATMQIQSYVESIEATRVIALDDGLARWSFLSNWFVWAISFLAILMISGKAGKNRIFSLIVTAGAVMAMVASLAWTGGRSVIIVMILPLILIALPRLRGVRWLAVPAGVVAAVSYIITVTENRSSTDAGFNVTTWLDWEWGRYSMTGFASEYVHDNGYALGESFLAGAMSVLLGVLRLVGLPISNPPLRTSTQMSGEYFLYSRSEVFIVPGLNAELFMNFGLVGIVVGCFVLGRITAWADSKYQASQTVLTRLAFAYVGTLLVFRTVAADSGSIYSYVLYVGAPLLVAAWYSKSTRSRHEKRQALKLKKESPGPGLESVLPRSQPPLKGQPDRREKRGVDRVPAAVSRASEIRLPPKLRR